MSKLRYTEALLVTKGACNPSAIAHAIFMACREIREEPGHTGTAQITSDPAIRLMVHQLSFITKAYELDDIGQYQNAIEACEKGGQ